MEWIIYKNTALSKNATIAEYKKFVNSNPYSGVWHQPQWLNFQLESGNYQDGFCFSVKKDSKIIFAGLALLRKLPLDLFYAYIPAGFLFDDVDEEIYKFFLENITIELKKSKTIYCDIDFIRPINENATSVFRRYGSYKTNKKPLIPLYTNKIDLSLSEEDILKQMKHKGRYNIKLSKKKGVTVREGTTNEIESFYNLLIDTTKRDGFAPHNLDYYKKMLNLISNCKLLIAEHERDILAAGIFVYTNEQALYYYGASSNIKRNLMAPYLLQWNAIKIGKELKCTYYDFMGIADPDNRRDKLTGVTEFKLKFGGEIVHFQDAYRIVLNNSFYLLYKIGKLLNG